MDIIELKVISGFLFFLLVVVFGWLPFCLYQRLSVSRYHDRYTMLRNVNSNKEDGGNSFAKCLHYFASGVLIATCLLHLLPESLEAVEEGLKSMSRNSFHHKEDALIVDAINESKPVKDLKLKEETTDNENESKFYPIAELLVALGFIFIYIFDSTIKSIQGRNKNMEEKHSNWRDCLSREQCDPPTARKENRTNLSTQNVSNSNIHLRDHSSQFLSNSSFFSQPKDLVNSTSISPNYGHRREIDIELEEIGFQAEEVKLVDEEHQDPPHSTDVKSMALVMALCIHGFFDGVMVGLQTSLPVIYSLLFAFSVHKVFVSISMSLTLARNYIAICASGHRKVSRYRYLLYVLLFASVAPLGIITSAGFVHSSFATSQGDGVSMVPGCLQSFAVGTFLYVTFTETTGHHIKHGTLCSEIQGHISLLAGFALMASLRIAFGET